MRDPDLRARPTFVARAARIAYAFVMMNCSAVAGLIAFALKKRVWR